MNPRVGYVRHCIGFVLVAILFAFFACSEEMFKGESEDAGDVFAEGESPHGIWYVDVDNTSGVYDGLTWETAFVAVQQGSVAAVDTGGEVWVAEGTYFPPLAMLPGVHLYGGFTGNETERDQRDWNAHPTVISGGTPGVTSADSATLDGFQITAGVPGMVIDSGAPVIRNCVFSGNVAVGEPAGPPSMGSYGNGAPGGSATNWALVISGGAPVLENCIFSENGAVGARGGDGIGSGYCVAFSGGPGGSAGGGGVQILSSGSGTFINCVFNSNYAYPGQGGNRTCSMVCGCGVTGGSGTLMDSGAIWFAGAALSVVNCTFAANIGGIVNASSHPVDIVNSIVWTGGVSSISTGATVITYSDVIAGYAGEGNINANPLFVNPDDGDLRLGEGSPCINLALESASPATDLLGVVRPQGAGPDMGAYEYPSGFEGESEPEGEGEAPVEGEGEIPVEGEGEPSAEGEGELAPITTLFNTGVDNSGTILVDNTTDPHYRLTVSADPTWAGPATYASGTVPAAWNLSGTDSRWIAARYPSTAVEAGYYHYQTTFDLTGMQPSTASISGRFSADNYLSSVQLNGTVVPQATGGFNTWYDFALPQGSAFVEGINTLVFIVRNLPDDIGANYSGLRVEMVGWAMPQVPVEGEGETPSEGEGEGDIWYVNQANGSGIEDGTSWVTAYRDIQTAVDAAMIVGGEVWVAAGTYIGSGQAVLTMKPGVFIYGGFAGTETSREERNWAVNQTAISGQFARHCVVGADNAGLDGFMISDGRHVGGGGLFNDHASPAITNCWFVSNYARGGDGADGCYIGGFGGHGYGGAIYNIYASPTIINCVFWNNHAIGGQGGDAVCCDQPAMSGNGGNGMGGAIYNDTGASPFIINCTFYNNEAQAGSPGAHVPQCYPRLYPYAFGYPGAAGGGAIFGNASVVNCILWNNIPNEYSGEYGVVPDITYSDVKFGMPGTGNMSADPLFLDAAAGNLELSPESPCVDVGSGVNFPEVDLLGISRLQCLGVDMGAYECAGPCDVPRWAPIPGLFNTGVDDLGNAIAEDAVDPHWELVASADPAWDGPEVYKSSIHGDGWMSNGYVSAWITPRYPNAVVAKGTYQYRITFDLTGRDPETAGISGRFCVDSALTDIVLNGVSVEHAAGGWRVYTNFTLPQGSPCVDGINTLVFVVDNSDGSASGFRAEVAGSALRIAADEGEGEGEPVHPADLDADWRIVINEAIAYLAGWQQGNNPQEHAIRSAYLWQNGERYFYDGAETPPLCWIPAP